MKLPKKKKPEPEPEKPRKSNPVEKIISATKNFIEPDQGELPPKWKPIARHKEVKRREKQKQTRIAILIGAFVTIVFVAMISIGVATEGHDDGDGTEPLPVQTETVDMGSARETKAETRPAEAVAPEPATMSELVVKFVDVGQGDASVIEFPDGKTMVIDTPTGEGNVVTSTLSADGRSSIDWLVATHPEADHIGGLDTIINTVNIGSVWAPEVNSSTQTYTRFLTAVANKGLSIEPCYAGRQIATGDNYSIDLLWPQQGATYSEDNAYSAIIKITYGENTFLFTGDAPVEAESQAVDGHVDVLKVSHHGSASGTNGALATKITPKIAVLSYGKNSYGHPTQVVLDALNGVGTQVFGTYVNGTVTVTSNGKDVSASVAKEGTIVAASQDSGASSQGIGTAGGGGGSSGQNAESQAPAPSVSQDTSSGDADTTVVVTPTGSKYHRPGCRTTKRSSSLTEMSKSQAQAQGYAPCGVCNP